MINATKEKATGAERMGIIVTMREELEKTYREIGESFDITGQRVHQIYKESKNPTEKKFRKHRVYAGALQRLARIKGCSNPSCTHKHTAESYHWHHYSDEKNFNLTKASHHSRDAVSRELQLVVPFCSGCHSRLHRMLEGRGGAWNHGRNTNNETQLILSIELKQLH